MRWPAALLALLIAAPARAAEPPAVAVDGGLIRGEERAGGGATFRGVPFAQPPVGSLRWRPPEPVQAWTGVREATRSASSCAQLDDGWNRANADGSSEDCLYLEVGTPELKPKQPLPVFIWIHGGSNKAGGGAGTVASSMVNRGIVLVSIQYRLGPLGFMAHRALTAESPHRASGNYGLMDQQAALRWVKRNIARFGGDPARVTIGGESAGAQDVGLQQLSPLADGLFAQAIQESGTAGFGFTPRGLAESEAIGEEIAAKAGAARATAAQLRALPAAALLEAARRIAPRPGMPEVGAVWLQATVDGRVITEAPADTLGRGGGSRVPLIIGANAQEIDFFPTADAARAAIRDALGPRAAPVLAFYGLDKPGEPPADPLLGSVPMQVGTDIVFTCPTDLTARQRTKAGSPVWLYSYTYSAPGGRQVGHASELPYVFANPGEAGIASDAPRLQAYWANFIKAGDPNGEGLAEWPRYGADRSYLTIGAGAAKAGSAHRGRLCELEDRP